MAELKNNWVNEVMATARSYSDVATYDRNGSATLSGGFLFYSNNPETVKSEATVDNGKWLCREQVSGTGRIVTWHNNGTGSTHTSGILVYNPNNSAITVSLSKINTTHSNGNSDVAACKEYLNNKGSKEYYNIPAHGYQMIYNMSVKNGYNYGMMMDISITSGKPIYLYDLLYKTKTDSAIAAATKVGSHIRGRSNNNKTTINLGTLKYVDKQVGVKVFGPEDPRTLSVKDSSDNITRKLNGNFGTVTTFKLKVTNNTSKAKNLKIGFGSVGGFLMCAAKMGETIYTKNWVKAFEIRSAIDLGSIEKYSSVDIEFDFIVGSVGSTALAFMLDEY